jgi:transcriptional regulator GlxA family with amidase domain
MEQNLTRPIAVAAVAQELGVSVRQLERLCMEHVGMGPASLYRQLRMRYANWLIENTDRSVTEIAIEAGFADCAHFSRQFKDTYGLSPSTRRQQPARASGDAARVRVFDPVS